MSAKSTALLLAAAGLLFAFVFFVERPMREAARIPPDRRVLPNLDPGKITAVEVQSAGGAVIRAESTNGAWALTQPIEYPADAAMVGGLLEKLAQWNWRTALGSEELTNHPDAEVEFGFVPPQFTLTLQQKGSQALTLYVGHISALGDEVYLKMRGGYQIFIADAGALQWMPREVDEWRDRVVMDVEHTPFQRIEVRSANPTFDYVLTFDLDPVSHLWGMTQPISARADNGKITGLLAQLQALRVQDFVPASAQKIDTGLQTPRLKLTFLRDKSATNIVFELQVGATPTNQTNLVFARRLAPDNVIEVAKEALAPWGDNCTNFLDYHLTSLSPSLITSIHANGVDEFAAQKSSNGVWMIHDGEETFPADESLMKDWLAALTNLTVAVEQLTMADVAGYGLDSPQLRYQIHYGESNDPGRLPLTELRFGVGTNGGDKFFERFEGSQSVNSLTRDQYLRLPKAGWQLRDRAIFHFDSNEVAAVEVRQRGAQMRFLRGADDQWAPAPGSIGSAKPDTSLGINETLYRMGRLRAVYWDAVGEAGQEPFGFVETDYRVDFEIKRGGQMQTNTIHFGKSSPYLHPYAYITREGRRLVFEFPADFYANWVLEYLSIPEVNRPAHS